MLVLGSRLQDCPPPPVAPLPSPRGKTQAPSPPAESPSLLGILLAETGSNLKAPTPVKLSHSLSLS